jgi:hypothetical protein
METVFLLILHFRGADELECHLCGYGTFGR